MTGTGFGIEIEMTGITREKAARVAAEYLNGTVEYAGSYYRAYKVTMQDGRAWKFMSDGSIRTERKVNGSITNANDEHSVEMVSPILHYAEDIETLQGIVRALRKAGAFTNSSCGIHVHLDGAAHTAKTIRNFVNIVAAKNDLLYRALNIAPERITYCKKIDAGLVSDMNAKKPSTLAAIEDIWYKNYSGASRDMHYHNSRYHFLNLHSFFHGHHTVELRGFNSELHAGKVRAYICLALALNNQALMQRCARPKKPQEENDKFAMRKYLIRIGLSGDEFEACREHLLAHLEGNAHRRYIERRAS